MLNRILDKIRHYSYRVDPTKASVESVYQAIFRRDLDALGIIDDFYPVSSAANYSLLYLITRLCLEFRPTSVIELGAGQSSILWSRLADKGFVGQVLTVEHDVDWASHIQAKVGHEVLLSPLRNETVKGVTTNTYDWDTIKARGQFDIVLCDGPVGVAHNSRWGVLNLIDNMADDCVLVMDDTERAGEQETVWAIEGELNARGVAFNAATIRAAKLQRVIGGWALSSCSSLLNLSDASWGSGGLQPSTC